MSAIVPGQGSSSLPNGAIVNDTAFYFSGQEPYPTIRIDDTPVKAGDVLWAKSLHRWLYYDGSTWTDTETDGTVKGGVAHFIRDTKPTVRNATPSNPTPPLVAGDRWYKKDDATEWFWNGTYWLSSMIYRLGSPVGGSNLGVQVNTGSYLTRSFLDMPATVEISYVTPLFFTEWVVELRSIGPVHDSTNYHSIEPGIMSGGASSTLPFGVDTRDIGGGNRVYKVPLNGYVMGQSIYGSLAIQRLWVQGFGTAPGFRIFSTLNYRLVA